MPPYADGGITMAQLAAAMVLELAPLVRGQALLPNYAQPLLTWQPTPGGLCAGRLGAG